MSETLSQNPDSSPGTTTDWSVLEGGGYDKETDVNQANPETTNEQFEEAAMDVIAARKKLLELSEASRNNPEDDGVWQATREQSVALQALIRRRNELAKQMANERPTE
jgi:hypothetical protein